MDRNTLVCQVDHDDLVFNENGRCQNYLVDLKYLRKTWAYPRSSTDPLDVEDPHIWVRKGNDKL